MLNKMTANILKRNIREKGINIDFYEYKKNNFGEINYQIEPELIAEIKGIFHEASEPYNTIVKNDKGRVETDKIPMILTNYNDCKKLKVGDFCTINGTKFNIISFFDVDLSNMFCEISLEVVFDV
jgi:hypothetical protein